MVCNNEIFRSVGAMTAFLGASFGAMLFGIVADAFGRKKAMLLMIVLNVTSCIVAFFTTSYEFYTGTVFFVGLSAAGLFMIPFIIAVEIVGASKRTFAGVVINYFWVAGLFLLTALAYFVRQWRYLRHVLGVPPVLFMSYWWFAINVAYFGLTLNVSNLSGNIYLNFFLSSVMELVAYVLVLLLLYRVGRKPLMSVIMMIGGLACMASIFPVLYGNASTSWTLTALSMVGKLGSSAAFAIVAIYIAELFPTVVRESGLATANVFGNIGGMIAPYIADLGILVEGELKDALPLIVFGGLSVVASLCVCFLPETRNRKLPETVKDAIEFGKKNNGDTYVIKAPETLTLKPTKKTLNQAI